MGSGIAAWAVPSLRVALASAAAVSVAAVAVRLAGPQAAEFLAVGIPRAYGSLAAWLTPPYLYLVINGIIISIAASSRFQKLPPDHSTAAMADAGPLPPPPPTEPTSPVVEIVHPRAHYSTPPVEYEAKLADDVVCSQLVADPVEYYLDRAEPVVIQPVEYEAKLADDVVRSQLVADPVEYYLDRAEPVVIPPAKVESKNEEEGDEGEFETLSSSNWSPSRQRASSPSEHPAEYPATPAERPPVYVRFGHRKTFKPTTEGKEALRRVARPRRNETLESTWRAITEGRAVPLARHLKKSDTWDVRGGDREDASVMRKSETFNERPAAVSPSPPASSGGGGGRLRREPSLGQDELNRRVEAFIKKFNDEMRLQRQESFKHYMEMINRGGP